jgi:hypothetical protein
MSSTDPVTLRFPLPRSILRMMGDPTPWSLDELAEQVAPKLLADDPVALAIVRPLAGTLLLGPRLAGGSALSPVPGETGWVPCVKLPSACLYLPSAAGWVAGSSGYELAGSDANLETLQQDLMAAMRAGARHTVSVSVDGIESTVVVNGAELPFLVLAEWQARP